MSSELRFCNGEAEDETTSRRTCLGFDATRIDKKDGGDDTKGCETERADDDEIENGGDGEAEEDVLDVRGR